MADLFWGRSQLLVYHFMFGDGDRSWVSSLGSDFNYDFGVAFTEEQERKGADYNFEHVDEPGRQREGMSVFGRQDGAVHHTYSTYARGVEALMGTYRFLDLAPSEGRCLSSWESSSITRPDAASIAKVNGDSIRALRLAGAVASLREQSGATLGSFLNVNEGRAWRRPSKYR